MEEKHKMAVRIQLRRDTAANWVSTNPVLRAGELGIETDTLQIKIGNGNAWNSITNYANVVPSDLNTTLGDYVLVEDIGAAGGVVGLDNDKNAIITGSSIIIEGTANAHETTITVTDPTADRTITLPDATGTIQLRVENITDTEIGYLDGVTSSIQTQLDAKIAKSLVDAKGDILVGSADNTITRLAAGTDQYVLKADSTATNGITWAALPITSSNTAITANTATTIDTIALTDFITAEYQVTVHQGTSTRSSKILVQTDGTSVDYNEYAIMATGTAIEGVAVAASVSSTNMVLQVTITNATTTNGRAFIIKSVTSGVAPAAPAIGAATYGDSQATVTFTPQDNGGSAVTAYTVTSNPGGITASGSASPITITGLTNATSYTFTVTATNKYGTSSASSASNSVSPSVVPVVTGGTLASDSTYYYRTFTSTGSLGVSLGNLTADVFTLAGGGSGGRGAQGSGGGGAGGLLYTSSMLIEPNTYTCTVGAGAAGGSPIFSMSNGNNSVFSGGSVTTQTAVGGGYGGYHGSVNPGAAGGSGGGGCGLGGAASSGGAGTAGQGFAGGNGSAGSSTGAGGGGAGGAGTNNTAGVGAIAYSSWLTALTPIMTGVSGWATATSTGRIASGGQGARGGGVAAQPGGGGLGGNSSSSGAAATGGSGISNTGGGGGGSTSGAGDVWTAAGGSGIIIVRYTKASVGG
jgi:hypothetical protein